MATLGTPLLPIMKSSYQNGISIDGFIREAFDGNWDVSVRTNISYPTFTITFPVAQKITAMKYKGVSMSFSNIKGGMTTSNLIDIPRTMTTVGDEYTAILPDEPICKVVQITLSSVAGSSPNWYGFIYEVQLYGERNLAFIEIGNTLYTVKNKVLTPIGDVSSITVEQYKNFDLTVNTLVSTVILYNGKDVPLLDYLQTNYGKFKLHTLQ